MSAVMTFEDSVKERLKSIVADLIPEERWDGIVKVTVQEFEKNDLPKLIKAELADQYKKAIAAEFAKPEWQATWENGQQAVPAALRKMIVDAAPLVIASMVGSSMQSMLYQFQQNIQNMRY